MDAIKCMRTRRSIRKYLSRPIEFDKIIRICEAGHAAPSAGNLQNWKFIVITDKHIIKMLPSHALNQEFVAAPVVIVICSNNEEAEKQYGIRGVRLYAIQNIAAAIENILLAAHAEGLGACWVGAFDEDKIAEICALPSTARAQALITMGYPDEIPSSKMTHPLEDVIFFNKYGNRITHPHLEVRNYADEVDKRIAETKESVTKGKMSVQDHVSRLIKRR